MAPMKYNLRRSKERLEEALANLNELDKKLLLCKQKIFTI